MKPFSLLRPKALCLASAFSLAGLLTPTLLAQSQNNTSVAEAARKAKEQKKPPAKESLVITEETLTLRPASADTGEAPPAGTVINTTPVMPVAETPAAPAAPAAPTDAAAPAPSAETAKTNDASAPAAPATDTPTTPPGEPTKPADSSARTPAVDTPAPAPADSEAEAKKAEEQAAEIAKTKEMLARTGLELDLFKRQLALDSESFYSQPDYAHDRTGRAKLDDQQKQIEDKQASLQELKDHLAKLIQEAGISPDTEQTNTPPAQ